MIGDELVPIGPIRFNTSIVRHQQVPLGTAQSWPVRWLKKTNCRYECRSNFGGSHSANSRMEPKETRRGFGSDRRVDSSGAAAVQIEES